MQLNDFLQTIPTLVDISEDANHVDWKRYDSDKTIAEFVAGFMAYFPGWLKFLYQVRAVLVRFLGMKQDGLPQPDDMHPDDVPMIPGAKMGFFEVTAADPDNYWIAHATEKHLTAYLAVMRDPVAGHLYVVTVVHYHHWTGPVYFNIIRPFHHIVVHQMSQSGVRYQPAAAYSAT
ncbi:MAG: DUF2867 domain-containing protein [Aggregatilineales bacterium]